ncbi:MAG: hypothetical protein IT373_22545, partial [Polyangiaceae bacterium]|nr:hypothetical protein [Polyangiaceae bacterium]
MWSVAVLLAACAGAEEGSRTGRALWLSLDGEGNGPDVAATFLPHAEYANPVCADLDPSWLELRIDAPVTGSATDPLGGATVNIVMNGTSGLDFTADNPIAAVLLKSGTNGHTLFDYGAPGGPGPQWADDGLVTAGGTDILTVLFCYRPQLKVSKTAETSFGRAYDWDIDKTSLTSSLVLSPGQQHLVTYETTVSVVGAADSAAEVHGTITIVNPSGYEAWLYWVRDTVSVGIDATVDCGVGFPYVLGQYQTLECTYSTPLPDTTARVNTAVVETYAGIVDGASATADVIFGDPASVTDACVSVIDDHATPADASDDLALGDVCVGDAPHTFSYAAWLGPYEDPDGCGQHLVTNTASFVSCGGGDSGSDAHTIAVEVPCPVGCTLTQGYWKTHSAEGPAPYDEAWQLVGSLEEDTLLLNSGRTWYEVFWTAPAGRVWYQLAHQYMAAKLNVLDGADDGAVADALVAAEALLSASAPDVKSKGAAKGA